MREDDVDEYLGMTKEEKKTSDLRIEIPGLYTLTELADPKCSKCSGRGCHGKLVENDGTETWIACSCIPWPSNTKAIIKPKLKTLRKSKEDLEKERIEREAEHERRMEFARMEVSAAWTKEETKDTVMDPILAKELAEIMVIHMYEPHLGCATTCELLDEIKARVNLDYTTMGQK